MRDFDFPTLSERLASEVSRLSGELLCVIPTQILEDRTIGYIAWRRRHDNVMVSHRFVDVHDQSSALLETGYYSNPDQRDPEPVIRQAACRAVTCPPTCASPNDEQVQKPEILDLWREINNHADFVAGALFIPEDLDRHNIEFEDIDIEELNDALVTRGNDFLLSSSRPQHG